MNRSVQLLLGAGAAVGLALAAVGAFNPTNATLPRGIVARVNGKAITASDLAVALERSENGEPGAPPPEKRREILNFLIDQELLVQRGVAIGLLDSDQTVRKAVAMAMIDAIVAAVLAREPTEEELRAFYTSHQAVFTIPAQAHVQHLSFRGGGDLNKAKARAEQVQAALANGMSFADAKESAGDSEDAPLPDALAPVHILSRYLGPTLAEATLALKPGEISQPLLSSSGYHLLRLVAFTPEQVRPYNEVKQEVRNEYLHRKRDDALQQHLDRRRARAAIGLSPEALLGKPVGGDRHEQPRLSTSGVRTLP